jgi:large subunit ribosomal protein L5
MPADRKGRKPEEETSAEEARKEKLEARKEKGPGVKEARPADEGVVKHVRIRRKRKVVEEEEEGPVDLGPQEEYRNLMQKLQLEKVVVNIGVGEPGEKVVRAAALLENLTGQKSVKTAARKTNRDFNVRKGDLIGCKVTLRKEVAKAFLKRALDAVDGRVQRTWFDEEGNFSFGVDEHINIPGVQDDPSVGIYGMDVCVTVARKGYRVKHRRLKIRALPRSHRVAKLDAMRFIRDSFNARVV